MTEVNIVFLDSYTMNPGDLDWSPINEIGRYETYEHTLEADVVDRAQSADILVVNKTILNADIISQLPWLKCICVSATGYNNIDLAAAKKRDIPVCNVSGYGTTSVAQHVFALLLELTNQVALHAESVRQNKWHHSRDFSYWEKPVVELSGKTMGIYGMGRIGQEVANIATAFGMNVIYNSRREKNDVDKKAVDVDILLRTSDVLCLTASLSEDNKYFINKYALAKMKKEALLINTSRGALIDEIALFSALSNDQLSGAALDVLAIEPPIENHPLTELSNCIITPHMAWASRESRERLLKETAENIKAFLKGEPRNVVN